MNRQELTNKYWSYYLLLEKRFLEALEYVQLDKDNYKTFSNGSSLFIIAAGAEIDSVFKEYCEIDGQKESRMNDYAQHILQKYPTMTDQVIVLKEYSLEIKPFAGWDVEKPSKSLKWWADYTSIKHNRFKHIKQANMENALNLLGALYLLEIMLLKKVTDATEEHDIFDEPSKLFYLKDWKFKTMLMSQMYATIIS